MSTRSLSRQAIETIDVDGVAVGVVDDPYWRAALVELGDPSGVLVDGPIALPSLDALLPANDAVRLQLIVARWPTRTRVLLAVNAPRAADPILVSAVRRVRRRFDGRPLAAQACAGALADLATTSASYVTAQRDGAAGTIRALHTTGAMPEDLPLGGVGGPTAALAGLVAGHDPLGVAPIAKAPELAPVPASGLAVGVNRHGRPVLVSPFRAEPTTIVVVGGRRAAEVVVARAAALGVAVQSGQGSAAASPAHPLLVIENLVPVPGNQRPWRTVLTVRDQLAPADLDLLAGADLALLQRLSDAEASLAASALRLGDSAAWLTRIRSDMVGVVARVPAGGRAIRWAKLPVGG
jgi:hypothetical protein